MKLSIKRDILLKPLLNTAGFVERKQTTPILANVYIKKENGLITLVANDLEIQASVTTNEPVEGEDFTITLPSKKLQDILKILPEGSIINFESQDSKILIKSGKTKFVLQTLPAEHYPLLKITEKPINSFSIAQDILKKLIGHTQYAMADKDSRVFLNGTLLEIIDSELRLVATDAHRLAYVNYTLGEAQANSASIIPRKTILELYRLLEDKPDTVKIDIYPSQVQFEVANKKLTTKVIDGKYPNYQGVIPATNEKQVQFNRLELLAAVDRVSQIGIDKLKTLNFKLTPQNLIISCQNEEHENSVEEIELNLELNDDKAPNFKDNLADKFSDNLDINFNSSYIRDLLINSEAELLQWDFKDGASSALVREPNNRLGFKAVIMPLRA